MLELWGMQNTPSLPSLAGLLWPRMVGPDRCCIRSYLPYTKSFPQGSLKREKGTSREGQ